MRLALVLACLALTIQCIQSTRAIVVVSSHAALASGAAASAAWKSTGITGSGSCSTGLTVNVASSPMVAPERSRTLSSNGNQWLSLPSGSSVTLKASSLMVPSTVVLPRRGSVSLTSLGNTTKARNEFLSESTGRNSRALNVEVALLWLTVLSQITELTPRS